MVVVENTGDTDKKIIRQNMPIIPDYLPNGK